MTKILALASSACLMSTAAFAGTAPVQVSEPGMMGILAGGVILALVAYRARK